MKGKEKIRKRKVDGRMLNTPVKRGLMISKVGRLGE